ncbi:hypothetical protein CR513_51822, partial [Mucuna pruriens]
AKLSTLSNFNPFIEKFFGYNYSTCAFDIMQWISGQGYKDHHTTIADSFLSICSSNQFFDFHVIYELVGFEVCAFYTDDTQCFYGVCHDLMILIASQKCSCCLGFEAYAFYTNDTEFLYGICHDLMILIALQKVDGPMLAYIGSVHAAPHDFNELLPLAITNPIEAKKEFENCSTFFMLFALYDLLVEYSIYLSLVSGVTHGPHYAHNFFCPYLDSTYNTFWASYFSSTWWHFCFDTMLKRRKS